MSTPPLNNNSNLTQSVFDHRGQTTDERLLSSVDETPVSDRPARAAVLGALKPSEITQLHVQEMPDDQIDALNREEVMALVKLLPESYQKELEPHLQSLKQIQVAVDRPVRAKVGNEWKDISPDQNISREQYINIMKRFNIDPESSRGMIKFDGEHSSVPFRGGLHRVGIAKDSSESFIDKTKNSINKAMQMVGDWASLRVGRPYVKQDPELLDALKDLVLAEKSILIIGPPGVGKTTLLRALASIVAEDRNVVVVEKDRGREVGGERGGDLVGPHAVLGKVLRMGITENKDYAMTLQEAVKNHGPDIIVTDEIKTHQQAGILSSAISDSSVVIATTHGGNLTDAMRNPALEPLLGTQVVSAIGDKEAQKNGGAKLAREFEQPPNIDAAVVMRRDGTILVYENYGEAANQLLRGQMPRPLVYPASKREGFDYYNGTGEKPEVFARGGAIQGRAYNNPSQSQSVAHRVSPRRQQKDDLYQRKQEQEAATGEPVTASSKQRASLGKQARKDQNYLANQAQNKQKKDPNKQKKDPNEPGNPAQHTHGQRGHKGQIRRR